MGKSKVKNKLKVVIPSYNNEEWVKINLESILEQDYDNYEVLYINDCSTDNTRFMVEEMVGDNPKFKIHTNKKNMKRGYNIAPKNLEHFFDDEEDILVFIDGDDWLPTPDVFSKVNDYYNNSKCWMTYGGMVCWEGGDDVKPANPQNSPYPDNVHSEQMYRRDMWRASHLRTFKWFLYNKIKDEDLRYSKTDEYYFHAEDLASSYPCLEMCPKNKIGVVDFTSYVFNAFPSNRARGVERENQAGVELETEIRYQKPYNTLPVEDSENYIVPTLAGGLGNMMFQIAASIGLSKDTNHQVKIDYNHIGTLHRPPSVYEENIFRNIPKLTEKLNEQNINVENFTYEKIKLPLSNIKLDGYFQSPKYFEHCKEEIINLFSDKNNNPMRKGYVSLHIRRGDYTKLSQYHHNIDLQYYLNAIDYFNGYNFLVFSDDIDWCKDNFKGDNFTFIEGQDDVQDLYMMAECEHNVIANSTFSWWGAYLNTNPNKVVIYPDKWFGEANSHLKSIDIFPDEWICLTEDLPKSIVNLVDGAFKHLANSSGRYSQVHRKISKNIKYVRDLQKWDGVTLVTDSMLDTDVARSVRSKYKIGWLLECREINPISYNTFDSWKDNYDFILTYDSELLSKYPEKTRLYNFGGSWVKENNYGLYDKTKNISMIYSEKNTTEGHRLRHQIANLVESGVDLLGRGTPNPIQTKEDGLVDYRYSIVIENVSLDNYFTEKLIDCLMVGTIPIYWGCPNVSNYFNTDSILSFNNLEELNDIFSKLDDNFYNDKLNSIKYNLEEAKKYCITEDLIYENILKELV